MQARGIPTFPGPYPADQRVPAELARTALHFPFMPGPAVVCQQGNNTIAMPGGDPASHGPHGLRYALDFSRGDRTGPLPLLAPLSGKAYVYDRARVNAPDNWGLGNTVLIALDNGYAAMLCHLDRVAVRNGERVAAGRMVGTLGTSGSAGNPHLHFQVVPLLRTPDPVNEIHHGEFSTPWAPRPEQPFGETVPFFIRAHDVSRYDALERLLGRPNAHRGIYRSTELVGAEAGEAWELGHWYTAP